MTTVNISLPKDMYKDVKKALEAKRYASLSELVRDALRKVLYPTITENGFTPEFEEEVLKFEAEPMENDKTWETEEDVKKFFKELRAQMRKKKNGKS